MSSAETRKRIIGVITDHFLRGPGGKLTITEVSERARISRQIFNRAYSDLKVYVTGNRPCSELLDSTDIELLKLLAQCQARIKELEHDKTQFDLDRAAAMSALRQTLTTTLMCSDITISHGSEIRARLEKQSQHNSLLVKDKLKLQAELIIERLRVIELTKISQGKSSVGGDVLTVAPDLTEALKRYAQSKDAEAFEIAKDKAIDALITKINILAKSKKTVVVLYIDRFLAQFENYVEVTPRRMFDDCVVVRLPIFSRHELKLFAVKVKGASKLVVHFPICVNDLTKRAQRNFLFRDVPLIEREAADRMLPPQIEDGFDDILMMAINQGD